MIIRATRKICNIARIKPVKNPHTPETSLPGEWFVDMLSLGQKGKTVLHFMHNPTKMSIIVPGKSVKKAVPEMKERAAGLLSRHGLEALIFRLQLQSEPEFYTTNDRHITGVMNQCSYWILYESMMSEEPEGPDITHLEDHLMEYISGVRKTGKKKSGSSKDYERPVDLLQDALREITG